MGPEQGFRASNLSNIPDIPGCETVHIPEMPGTAKAGLRIDTGGER